eukprot:c17770_g1_i1.p2 GENE.c17770_g1_i1~~c17770_g1_i1.p2  ORF type:complete len:297 (+),score=52.48 c17770_g1_i1:141-1031(+)
MATTPTRKVAALSVAEKAGTFFAGSMSSSLSTIALQPLDTIKTRLQTPIAVGSTSGSLRHVAPNMRTVSLAIIRQHGLLGFWKGTTPSLMRVVPAVGTHLSILRAAEELYADVYGPKPMGPLAALVLAGSSRSLVAVAFQPFGLIKTRMESAVFSHYSNPLMAMRAIVAKEGLLGLFRGTVPTVLRDAPFSGIYYSVYSALKAEYDDGTATRRFALGTLAGFGATIVTQPLDVIRTRVQLNQASGTTILRVAQDILRESGSFANFLRGFVPRATRRVVMASATWTLFEQIMERVSN